MLASTVTVNSSPALTVAGPRQARSNVRTGEAAVLSAAAETAAAATTAGTAGTPPTTRELTKPAFTPPAAAASLSGSAGGLSIGGVTRNIASVPDQIAADSMLGRGMLRTMRGVIDSAISFLVPSVRVEENKRPKIGMSPSPGRRCAFSISSSWIRPISVCVSPSFNCSTVVALRVPTR